MDNYLEINGKYYAVDMDKVVEFIGEDTASVVQAINQTYGIQEDENGFSSGDMHLLQKDVTETKENVGSTMSGYKYNLITNMLGLVLSPVSDYNDSMLLLNDLSMYGAGQKIAFNTLVGMGIIYEIETDE